VLSKSTRVPHDENSKLATRKPEKPNISADQDIKTSKNQSHLETKPNEHSPEIRDLQLVPEYFDECLEFMLSQ
jgi:hypothetical protein